MKAEAEYKKELQELSQKERKAKEEWVNETCRDSVGNKLSFGANVVKFEPPPEQRKGG